MLYQITEKSFSASTKVEEKVVNLIRRLSIYMPNLDYDLGRLSLLVRQAKSSKFEGVIRLRLPKRILIAHFREETLDKALNVGFEKILKEFKEYKNKYFSSMSDYPSQLSIRKFNWM